jgi:hypothetical protein
MKDKILFFNNSIEACGVYQYGKRTANIVKKSLKFDFIYLEVSNQEEVRFSINHFKPTVCIFNYHPITMHWLDLSEINICKVGLVHETEISNFDFYIHLDPQYNENKNNFKVVRPILKFDNFEKIKNNIPSIGSFGFGFENKGFDKICSLVNDQFDEAVINLNITFSHYCGNNFENEQIKQKCLSKITKPNIKLNLTNNFISDKSVLDFLNSNDINIFAYDHLPNRGASSVLDYVIAIDKPIGLSSSHMFRHVNYKHKNLFSIESNSIIDIINNPIDHILSLREEWSHDNLIAEYEKIIEKISFTI